MWKKIRRNYRRLVAFLLTAVIVGTNVCGNVGVAFAAGMSESALFLVDGEELREAIQEAKEHREVFSFSALELAAARKSIRNKYEKLLGKKDGEVYELDLEIDDSYAPEGAAVQVFYHAGTEDVVFLFLNETDMEVEYRVNIDGYETEPVTVKPNTYNIEEEEDASFGENYEAADMIDDVKTAPKAEVVETKEAPAGEESEEAGKDETAKDASPDSKGEESSAVDETLADEEESQETEADSTEAATEEGTEKAGETEAADKEDEETDAEEEQVTETEAETETETETEPQTEAEVEDADEVLDEREEEALSKSNRQAAVVALSLGDLEEETTAETEVSAEEETEAAETEKETEAEEPAEGKTEEAAGSETTEDEEKETEAEAGETEYETEEESKAEDTETEKSTEAEETEAEETEKDATVEETEAEDKTAAGETKGEEKEEIKENSVGSNSSQTGSTDKTDGQLLEDDSIEFLGRLKGKDYATVTLKNHVNARALKVAWEDIEEIISEEEEEIFEYLVDYYVNLPEGASVEGADRVAEGEDLYFAVDVEEGYEIAGVYANGEELEEIEDAADRASASDWESYAHVYVVEAVEDDLTVEVEVEEPEELAPVIAAATYTAETDDAVVTVNVPDGAFTEEVDLKVAKIENEDQVEALKIQANSLLEEGQVVAEFLAYDVSFVSKETGDEAEPMYTVAVNIQVKKPMVSKDTAETEAIGVSVLHLPEDGEAKVVTSTEKADETEFAFETDSFSPYGVALLSAGSGNKAKIGDTEYESLQKAIEASQQGDVIVLLDSTDENITSNGKEYTLDMQGRILRCGPQRKNVFTVNGGNVTIQNGTITGGDWGNRSGQDGIGLYITSGAVVSLENCLITENMGRASGGVHVTGQSELTLTDCRISGNTGINGGGVVAENSTVVISGGSITDNMIKNTNDNSSGGVMVKNGSLSIDGTEISDNTNGSGGFSGLYALNSVVSLKNTALTGNKLKIDNTDQVISFENVEVKDITDRCAAYVKTNGIFVAENCKFHDNVGRGGASGSPTNILTFVGTGTKTLTNCQFTGNIGDADPADATNSYVAGPVRITAGDVVLNNCTFSGNTNWKYGTIYSNTTGTVTLNGCQITGNDGVDVGGVFVTNSKMDVLDSVIKNNTGINKAGGIQIDRNAKFSMTGGALYNNRCEKVPANDVNMTSTPSAVTIQKASAMSDGDVDFSDYVWANLNNQMLDGELTVNSDFSFKTWNAIKRDKCVARLNGKDYETLTEALTAAKNGDTIDLVASYIPIKKMFTVDKEITVNMNGCYIFADNPGNDKYTNTASGTQGVSGGVVARGGIFKVAKGGTLNLSGKGTMGNRIIMAGGELNFNGDVFIKLSGSSNTDSAPVAAANYDKEVRGGTVNVNSDMDFLKVYLQEGEFRINENASVNNLNLELRAQTSRKTFVKAEINGPVTEMTLSQSISGAGRYGTAEELQDVTLNSAIGSLALSKGQDSSYGYVPVTKAGPGLRLDSFAYTVTLTAPYDKKTMANPTIPMDDIMIIQGDVKAEQINLANADWKSGSTYDMKWYKSDGGDDKNYKFLITVAVGDKGIVLRKNLPTGAAVFLDGKNGKDTNDGKAINTPVKTFSKAKEILKTSDLDTIYVIGTVSVTGTSTRPEKWSLGDLGEGKTLKRYATLQEPMVNVPSGKVLELGNIVIDGGNMEVTAPIIKNIGTLNITAGTVLQNNINTYNNFTQYGGGTKCEGGAVWSSGTLNMSGGTITNNTAVSGGGVFTEGVFNFSGGDITGNKGEGTLKFKAGTKSAESPSGGGGVFVAFKSGKMNMSGGTISGNSAMAGGGIALGNLSTMYIGGTLTMTGGTIEGNTAENKKADASAYAGGGGIYVQATGVAEITGGSIIGNHSEGGMFGGGGIYVNGGKQGYKNGLLKLKKVKVSENSSDESGGGIAGCPSSDVEIYLTDGGLIHGNNGGKDDIFITSKVAGYYGTPNVDISRYMINGGVYGWKDTQTGEFASSSVLRCVSSGNIQSTYEARIYASVDADDITVTDDDLSVFITGNTSRTRGGGIGTNGDVVIGTEDDTEKTQIKVTKQWRLTEGGPVLTDAELNEPGSINDIFKYTRVHYTLWGKYATEGEDAWQVIDRGSSAVQSDGKWFVSTFSNLDLKDAAGNEWVYKVTEDEDDLFTGEVVDNKDGTWTVTNTPVYSLKISKKVVNTYEDEYPEKKTFTFTVTLKDKDGNLFNGDLTAVNQNDETSTISFVDGKASVDLADAESVWIKGIPAGSVYSVEEDPGEDYEASIVITTHQAGRSDLKEENISGPATGDQTISVGVNDVTYTNTTKVPHGSLVISKTVAGGGDLEKEWNFTVELFKKKKVDSSEEDTEEKYTKEALKPETGKVFDFTYTKKSADGEVVDTGNVRLNGIKAEFGDKETGVFQETISLAHGQSVMIEGLPAGASYLVTEEEANEGDYVTTVTGEEGIIVNKQTKEVKFTNTEVGGLTIHKTVEGTDGDKQKDWEFTVNLNLTDEEGNSLFTGTEDPDTFITYKKYNGVLGTENEGILETGTIPVNKDTSKAEFTTTLKHGEYITISNLPTGTGYDVSETEANTGSYVTTVNNEAYVDSALGRIEIEAGKEIQVHFVNDLQKVDIEGKKVWDDAGNQDGKRPQSITVNLYADGELADSISVTAADAENSDQWNWKFTGLPKYENGAEIKYTVTEDAVADYSTAYDNDNFVITNKYTPGETSYTVQKIWSDEGDKDKLRPNSISVQLMQNGETRDEAVILNAENGWTYTWSGLPQKSNGQDIEYRVAEIGSINGYTVSYNYTGNTTIITNTHTPENPPDEPGKPGRPNRPGGGGGNPPRGGDNPGGPGTTTTIETPEVPLANFPPEPIVELPEEMDVPLAALPRTGDSRQAGAMMALFGIAGLGALFSAIALHKKKDDQEG